MLTYAELARLLEESLENELSSGDLNFPTSHIVNNKIREKLKSIDKLTVQECVNIVQTDPLLLAKIFKLAKATSNDSNISSVLAAVQTVGVKLVTNVIYLTCLEQSLNDKRNTEVKKYAHSLWVHSLELSCWSYAIARTVKGVCKETAMAAGLLCNLSQFFILSKIPELPDTQDHFDTVTQLVQTFFEVFNSKLIHSLELPKDIQAVYQGEYFSKPKYPCETIVDIVNLAGILSEVNSPFLKSWEEYKVRLFYVDYSDEEIADMDLGLNKVREEKNLLMRTLISN